MRELSGKRKFGFFLPVHAVSKSLSAVLKDHASMEGSVWRNKRSPTPSVKHLWSPYFIQTSVNHVFARPSR